MVKKKNPVTLIHIKVKNVEFTNEITMKIYDSSDMYLT